MLNNIYNPDVLSCLANLSNDEVFTPPKLANDILDLLPNEIWSDPNITFLDPVCKSGVFLREIAKRLDKGLERVIKQKQKRINHIFTKQIFGIAITELTSLLTRRTLYGSKSANGKFSFCEKFDSSDGNIYFKNMKHTWEQGRCVFCGGTKDIYERDTAESYAYNFIHIENPEEIFNMKFDVIIGNPPYQLNVGVEKENFAIPLYHKFIEQALKLNPRYLTMIIPSRWFTGGRGLDEFRKNMIQDKRIKNIVDYTDSRDCFPGVDIAGGICYFLIDREYSGKCKFTNITNGISRTIDRNLDEYDIVPRHIDALSIITKVKSFNEESLDSCVSVQTPFGFHTSFRGNDKAKKEVVNVLTSKGWVKCERSDITKGISMINQYKVIFTAATTEHAGQVNKSGLRKVISSLQIIKPNCICTQSYLVGGSFDNEDEAKNMLKYFQTKFLRFLLFQAITSQHISRDKFQFVPVQDFKFEYDDKYLFDKYQLNEEEISLIENSIAPI